MNFAKGFSGLFCINITWHYGNLNVKSFLMIPPEIYFKKWKHKDFRNSQNHKKPLNSTLVPRPPKHPPPPKKKQFLTFLWFQGVISCRIKPPKKSFLVFLVEFQVYFTGFLKVYVIVLLLRKYLTSKIEKNVPHGLFCKFMNPWSWKENFHNLKCT